MKNTLNLALVIILTLLSMACAHTPPDKTLFDRIGGIPVLTVVVSETIDQVSTDPKIKRSFEGIKLAKLKESVVNQLCRLTGGGCEYDGETMKNSHADLKITTAEFELFVQAFRDALNRHVATREKNELLKILAPMKRDIVSDKT
ncbi:MAG TPA: group 1 truncated hemoglobin [Methylophilaceae bacterium]|nr:group 1 truncated hemoglobin [Methylophilaceae bacterium]